MQAGKGHALARLQSLEADSALAPLFNIRGFRSMLNCHRCRRPLGGGNAESLVPAVPPVLQLTGPAAVRYEPALSTFVENDAVAPFRGCTVDALLVSGRLFFCRCIGGLATRAVSGGGLQGFALAADLFVPAFPVLELAGLAAICDFFAFRATLERGSPVSWDAAVGAESGGRFGSHFLLKLSHFLMGVFFKIMLCFFFRAGGGAVLSMAGRQM